MEWVGLFGVELDNIKKNSPSNVLTNYIMYIKAQKWKREMHKIQGIKKHFSKVCLSFPYCSRMEKPLDYINELSFWIAFKTHDLFHHYSNEKQSTINQNSDINDQHNYFYCSKYPYLITNGIYLKRSVTHLFSVIIARFLYGPQPWCMMIKWGQWQQQQNQSTASIMADSSSMLAEHLGDWSEFAPYLDPFPLEFPHWLQFWLNKHLPDMCKEHSSTIASIEGVLSNSWALVCVWICRVMFCPMVSSVYFSKIKV